MNTKNDMRTVHDLQHSVDLKTGFGLDSSLDAKLMKAESNLANCQLNALSC